MSDQEIKAALEQYDPDYVWPWQAPPPPPPPTDLLSGLVSSNSFQDLTGKTHWDRVGGCHWADWTDDVATDGMWPFLHRPLPSWTISGNGTLRVGSHTVATGSFIIDSNTALPNFSEADHVYFDGTDLNVWNRVLSVDERNAWRANPRYPFDGSTPGSIGAGKPLKVVLCFGQSNMVGYAPIADLADPYRASTACPHYPALAGTPSWRRNAAPEFGNKLTFGPELSLGETLGDGYAMVKYAISGSNVYAQWKAGSGVYYIGSRDAVAIGMAELSQAGFVPSVHSILWMQGHGDSNSTMAPAYEQNLTDLFAQWRINYGPVPIVYNRMPEELTHRNEHARTVRDAQDALAGGLNHLVSAEGQTYVDSLHYDAPSMIQMGIDRGEFIKAL